MMLPKREKLLLGGVGLTAVSLLYWQQRKKERPVLERTVSGSFALEPFQPAYVNPHLQTLLAHFARGTHGVAFRRERVELPDGDFIDLDFADVAGNDWVQLGETAPIVLVLHGLEGSARRSYTCELYRQLAERGIRAVGMNFRSCSDEMNRLARMYHAGETADLAYIFDLLQARYPAVAWGMVGFSLGANMLLKFLGEQGAALRGRLKTAVAVSPPFDMASGASVLDYGSGRPYRARLLRSLQHKLVEKRDLLADEVDYERGLRAKTFYEFDDACTAPLNGFANAADYYACCSSGQFLATIQVPTLLLRAEDDPFFADDIPYQTVAENRYLQAGFVRHGGHVAFVEGSLPGRFRYWAERQAARFAAHHLFV